MVPIHNLLKKVLGQHWHSGISSITQGAAWIVTASALSEQWLLQLGEELALFSFVYGIPLAQKRTI